MEETSLSRHNRMSNKSTKSQKLESITSRKSHSNKPSEQKFLALKETHSFSKPDSSITLAYREFYKKLHSDLYNQKLKKKVSDKSHVQGRSNKQILNYDYYPTKYIPEGITDVDKNYFKIIQVRSKQKKRRLNRKQYLNDINNCLRENIITGYYYDEMFKIDEQFETEKSKLKKVKENFSRLSGYFEMFLDDDHKESMNLIAASIRETSETEKRRDIFRKNQERLGRIRNDIYSYEEIYEKTLSCAAFILSITPEEFYNDEDTRSSFSSIKSKVQSNQTLEELQLQMEEVKKLKPKLYFKNPWDILQIFRDIEVQNLKFMLHTLEFKAKIQEQIGLINLLKSFSENELTNIQWKVLVIEKKIESIELQTKNLEGRCNKLLDQEYREFVSGNDSILLHAYLAETYWFLMGREPSESPTKNLQALGAEYKRLKFQADSVPSAILNDILVSVYNSNRERTMKAKVAIRKLTDFDILIKRTIKLLDKPEMTKRRKLMTRSPVTSKPKRKPPPPPPISEEELLKLYLFTDMCRPEHPLSQEVGLQEDQFNN